MQCDSPSPPLLSPCSGLWDAPRESNTPSAGEPLHVVKDNSKLLPIGAVSAAGYFQEMILLFMQPKTRSVSGSFVILVSLIAAVLEP